MTITNTRSTMNVYQRARRARSQGDIDPTDLMHYCEEHSTERTSKVGITTMIYEYLMPDGATVTFEGLRQSNKDAFVPKYWSIRNQKTSIGERIQSVLSIFKRK